MLVWQSELIADLLKGYWLQKEDKYNPNPFFLPHTGDEWNPRGKFLLQQIGASPEEKLSQLDNLQISFQAWKVDENRRLFLNPNHSILYLLISLPKNKGHRKKVHNEPKLPLTGTKPGQNNLCQTSNIRKSNTSVLPIRGSETWRFIYSFPGEDANQGKICLCLTFLV